MSLPTIRSRKHAFVPPVPSAPAAPTGPTAEQLLTEVVALRQRLGECEAAYRGWRHRALVAELTLRRLPAALANPDALIRRLFAEAETARLQNKELRQQLKQLQRPTTDQEGVAR
ncbi:hypothetical protein [Streptacidiphilus sp. EB103A]|uniref:hypothetical protein n=1 Tax=Streptacidiphilus sp. EB103A TaxID=3156275 RepID=UPI00351933E6